MTRRLTDQELVGIEQAALSTATGVRATDARSIKLLVESGSYDSGLRRDRIGHTAPSGGPPSSA